MTSILSKGCQKTCNFDQSSPKYLEKSVISKKLITSKVVKRFLRVMFFDLIKKII